MTLSIWQKIQLFVLFRCVDALRAIEFLGSAPIYSANLAFRTVSVTVLIIALGYGVGIPREVKINSLAYFFDATPPQRIVSGNGVLGASSVAAPEFKGSAFATPQISALSALVLDRKTDTVLFNKDYLLKLAPASTTKLMTALVALDVYKIDDLLKVPEFCTLVDSQKVGFLNGEEISVQDLLYAMLIGSAGDAACTLAANSGTDFVSLMNAKALAFGLSNTHFTNAIGLDDANFLHYSTSFDLYKLSKRAVEADLIKDAVAKKTYTFETSVGPRAVSNTNSLLWEVPGSIGIKTGKTEGAGEVLIYAYNQDSVDLAIVVMSSQDRFGDTKTLLNWVLRSFEFH